MVRYINIAVLGDLHGRLTLAYRLLRRWEREHRERISLILQVGDFGAFPTPVPAKRSTASAEESGAWERVSEGSEFAEYWRGTAEADAVFSPHAPVETRIEAPTIFIKGEREDLEFLDGLRAFDGPVPVDANRRIQYLPNARVWRFDHPSFPLSMAGLGGPAVEDGATAMHRTACFGACRGLSEVERVRAARSKPDILLTHEVPFGSAGNVSSELAQAGRVDIRRLIEDVRPTFHFCGHLHRAGARLSVPSPTRSYALNAVGFDNHSRLRAGCMGILRWAGSGKGEFRFVTDAWLGEYTQNNYRHPQVRTTERPEESGEVAVSTAANGHKHDSGLRMPSWGGLLGRKRVGT